MLRTHSWKPKKKKKKVEYQIKFHNKIKLKITFRRKIIIPSKSGSAEPDSFQMIEQAPLVLLIQQQFINIWKIK